MHALGKEPVESVHLIAAALNAQASLLALANHVASVARQPLQVGFDVGIQGGRECGVQGIVMKSLVDSSVTMAQLEVVDAPRQRFVLNRFGEAALRFFAGGADSGIDTEWHRNQTIADQPVGDGKERRYSRDFTGIFRQEVTRFVAKGLFDHSLPAGKLKKRALRMASYEFIPARAVTALEWANAGGIARL